MDRIQVLIWLVIPALVLLLVSGCGKEKKDVPRQPGITDPSTTTDPMGNPQPAASEIKEGQALYTTHCLVCHQVTGGGVSGLNPPLKGTGYVLGEKERLVDILLNGSNKGLEINGVTYSNAMPGFAMLSDTELARVATYIRNSFGNTADPVTAEEVATIRAAMKP